MSTAFSDTTAGKVFNFIIGREKKKHSHGDASREVFETVVFVVVLVLMLKLFVAEAFVIPTGSMATTLLGDHVSLTCPECGYEFTVSASAHGGARALPHEAICQNCGVGFPPRNALDWSSGDRVLVAKYSFHVRPPRRFEVPVFRFPEFPYSEAELSAMNYIKRLVGLPGETIAIYKGDLYRTTDLTYPHRPPPADPKDAWHLRWPEPVADVPDELGVTRIAEPGKGFLYVPSRDYTHSSDPTAIAAFHAGQFEPIRKTPAEILTVRRLVFDHDRQPGGLTGLARQRWEPSPTDGAGWAAGPDGFRHTGQATGWIRFQNCEPGWRPHGNPPRQPYEVTDFLAYNSPRQPGNWLPDLIVECRAEFATPTDKLTLELVKGGDRFRAEFDGGVCRLYRLTQAAPNNPVLMAEAPTDIKAGRYDLRLANVDSRLTVWVDGRPLEFGPGADYPPPSRTQFEKTDLDVVEPVRVGATGAVTVSRLQVWRDLYYTLGDHHEGEVETHYVQPGHYFCMGDNSASSSDARTWGLVPERLLLGRAVVVYWPPSRWGVIK